MPFDLTKTLVIGVSSRALFDLSHENQIFDEEGLDAYESFQLANENSLLRPGAAFPLIQALLSLNTGDKRPVEVIIMSRNSAETSLRIFNSIQHYKLDISRAALTGGAPLAPYLSSFNVGLFLSQHEEDVEAAITSGFPAAILYALPENPHSKIDEIRIAFDGDAVLFSEDSERIYQEQGLEAFLLHETKNAKNPLPDGPFAKLLRALSFIQSECKGTTPAIRTALVTARAGPAQERVIRTLRMWGIDINEAFFLGGLQKGAILKAFGAHMFFDDHRGHCEDAAQFVPTGRVPAKVRKIR